METDTDQPIETISRGFSTQLHLQCDHDHDDSASKPLPDTNDDDFTFMFVGGGDDTPIDGDHKVFEDGFPLFDQKLLLDVDYEVEEIHRLPPVDKIFIQSTPASSEHEENHDGPYCEWSTAELSKKSNSTGFSKLWRLKEKGGRSNSYGRDAFVFFKGSDKKTTATTTGSSSSLAATGDGTFKVNVAGGKAKVVKQQGRKGKKATTGYEAYMKSREHTEEDRRRSYLPYRQEIMMGFFTNVHGGLTKNVHPY